MNENTETTLKKAKYRIITGKVYWASLVEPNMTYEPTWRVDVVLDPATKKIVEGDGLTVYNKGDDRGDYVSLKRKVFKGDGSKREAPEVVDAQTKRWNGQLIGNGSLCNIKYKPYDWNRNGKSGFSAELVSVQVIDLIPYSKGFTPVDGYSIEDEKEVVNL